MVIGTLDTLIAEVTPYIPYLVMFMVIGMAGKYLKRLF